MVTRKLNETLDVDVPIRKLGKCSFFGCHRLGQKLKEISFSVSSRDYGRLDYCEYHAKEESKRLLIKYPKVSLMIQKDIEEKERLMSQPIHDSNEGNTQYSIIFN